MDASKLSGGKEGGDNSMIRIVIKTELGDASSEPIDKVDIDDATAVKDAGPAPRTPTAGSNKGGLQSLLENSKAGRFTLPVANLRTTSAGRPQRQAGVEMIYNSIKTNGWLASVMTVYLVGDLPEGGLTQDTAQDRAFNVLNGNHRLVALQKIDAESGTSTSIACDVHHGMNSEVERLAASYLNSATELVVKTTLSDRIAWYKVWYDEMQASSRVKAPLTPNAVANRLQKKLLRLGLPANSLPTIKQFMRAIEALKPRGLAALVDVTHLPGREKGNPDLKDGGLQYKRVTHKALLRPEFAKFSDIEQEVYVFRLASGAITGVMTEEKFKILDAMVIDVSKCMADLETHFPRAEWTDSFKLVANRSRNYKLPSMLKIHRNQLATAVEEYKKKLPIGMPPVALYVDFLETQPYPTFLAAMRGSEFQPNDMQRFYDDFVALKAKRKEDAEAVEGRFKAKIEANEKKAVAAAHAATIAAKKAKELEDAPALAAAAAQAARDAIAEVTDDDTDSTVKGTPTWAVATGAVVQPVSSVAPSVTEKGKNPDGDAEPAVQTIAGHKRKAAEDKAVQKTSETGRPMMTKLVILDVLDVTMDSSADVLHRPGQPFMMAFVNIAADPAVVKMQDRLVNALCFLSKNMHDRGTIVIALQDMEFERTRLKAMFKQAGLTLEDSPVVSLYLGGKSGRVSEAQKWMYPSQGSVTLLAHKSTNIICNGGGARSKAGASAQPIRAWTTPPRTPELDYIGAVVSDNHPPAGTLLAISVGDLLIKRFSDAGDPILVTASEGDKELSRLVLEKGRTLIALVPDATKAAAESKRLDVLSANASKTGMWSKMLSGPVVTVGAGVLPASVPSSNMSASTSRALAEAEADTGKSSGGENEVPPEMKVASGDAAMHGLEIRDSAIHGRGLFATKDLTPGGVDSLPLSLVGSFEVHNSGQECREAEKDGVPRFLVSNNLSPFLSGSEVARPGAALYLVPHRASPLFYLNSSKGTAECENYEAKVAFKSSRDAKGDIKKLLSNASNCVSFQVSVDVKKGEELLAFYNLREEDAMSEDSE